MHILFNYLLKAGACLLLFYMAYRFLFRRETFYHYNRIWLLGAFASSLLLPLLPLRFALGGTIAAATQTPAAAPAAAPLQVLVMQNAGYWDSIIAKILPWLSVAYVAVTAGLLLMHGLQLLHIRKLILQGSKQAEGNYCIIRSDAIATPFSFCHFIFLPADTYPPATLHQILLHEKAHAAQRHTWDTLFASFYCCICWFNPFAWMMKKALLLNLEYLADAAVLEQPVSAKDYQYNLVRIALSHHNSIIVNHFGQSFIKNRITMINKIPSLKQNKWKYFLSLPVIALAIAASSLNIPSASAQSSDKWEGYPGGQDAAAKFLSRHVRYPRVAAENSITGVVTAQFTVLPDGSITDISILKEPQANLRLGEEVKRVIALMPKFEKRPGVSQPVKKEVKAKFILDDGNGKMINAEPDTKADVIVVGYTLPKKSTYAR